jgi:dimethylaniline monooxygenase (N-oxide forming)
MRKTGKHVRAQDVNTYLQAYAEEYGLTKITKFGVTVEDVSFNSKSTTWTVRGKDGDQAFSSDFSHIVICTGLYHARHIPLGKDQTSEFSGNIWHSSEISDAKIREPLSKSESVVVVGAGKSAIDLATLVAQGRYSANSNQPSPAVKLVYRRPHWLAPRKLLRGTIPFEKVLFSRFVVNTSYPKEGSWQNLTNFSERLASICNTTRQLPLLDRRNSSWKMVQPSDLQCHCGRFS